ncbi:Abi family protein [Kocuria massiliensis]|uniref:Abi family protein n=1 Tax=Kocuria massiliensis TaxID=1926282 RepID=UPI0022B9CB95|nr:Abi family protein [Kocuria massiliensis]
MGGGLDLGSVTREKFAMFLYANNYYRVSGYSRCLYMPGEDRYQAGTSAELLMDIYEHDRKVRNLVLDGISVVEPTVRSRVAYHIAQSMGGGEGYLDESLYLPTGPRPASGNTRRSERWLKEFDNRNKVLASFHEVQDRKEIFIQHHVKNGEPIPFWAIVEVVSIGTFSRFFAGTQGQECADTCNQFAGNREQ